MIYPPLPASAEIPRKLAIAAASREARIEAQRRAEDEQFARLEEATA